MAKPEQKRVSESLKLIVKTSFIVFVGVVISKLLGYAYRVIVARYFGPEVYGMFSIALMVSGWFIAFSALGLSDGLLRFIPLYRGKNDPRRIKQIFKFTLWVTAISSIFAGLLLFGLSEFIAIKFFHNAELVSFLKIFSILVPVSVISYPYLASLRAFEKISWYSFVFNIAQNVIKVSFLGIFIILGMNSNAVTLSYMLGLCGMLVLSYIICRRQIPQLFNGGELKEKEKSELNKQIISYSIPILLFGVISMIFYWIDSFSIGFYKGATEVGFYNAAVPIALLLGIAPELFMQLFFPMITREYSRKNMGLIGELSKQVAKWILIINLPLLAIILVFPGAAINLIFGGQYLVAENALRILAIGSMLSSVLIISNHLITMIGKSKLVLMNIVIASAINFVLNMIFVPMPRILFFDNSLGLTGAAFATLLSVIVLNLLFVFQARKHLSIVPVRRKMMNIIGVAIIASAFLFYLRTQIHGNDLFTLGLLGGTFFLFYVALILLSRSLDKNDWEIVKSIWTKIRSKTPDSWKSN